MDIEITRNQSFLQGMSASGDDALSLDQGSALENLQSQVVQLLNVTTSVEKKQATLEHRQMMMDREMRRSQVKVIDCML